MTYSVDSLGGSADFASFGRTFDSAGAEVDWIEFVFFNTLRPTLATATNFYISSMTIVPEPGTVTLLLVGAGGTLAGAAAGRRRPTAGVIAATAGSFQPAMCKCLAGWKACPSYLQKLKGANPTIRPAFLDRQLQIRILRTPWLCRPTYGFLRIAARVKSGRLLTCLKRERVLRLAVQYGT